MAKRETPQYGQMVCEKCGRRKSELDFYKQKNGKRYPMCKECLTMHVDNRKPDTFLWILKEFDVPYIESVWVSQANKLFLKNPAKFGPKTVMGTYLRTMAMNQYCFYTYADSDKINGTLNQRKNIPEDAEREKELKRKLEAGEISEAEYNTLTFTNARGGNQVDNVSEAKDIVLEDVPKITDPSAAEKLTNLNGTMQQYVPSVDIDENTIKEELTNEDIKYLALKWGLAYKPSQWVQMEKEYNEYAGQFRLNVDRDKVLKNICKLSLKMQEALDIGDVKTYRDLATTYDMMRKSAKFTEVQKDEHERREIDSVGEIVAFVEREGGAIPCKDDPIKYPQDIIDFVIKDIKNYMDTLVKEELGLSDLIESYVKKLEQNKSKSVQDIMNVDFKKTEVEDNISDNNEDEFDNFQIQNIEEEAAELARLGEGNNGTV